MEAPERLVSAETRYTVEISAEADCAYGDDDELWSCCLMQGELECWMSCIETRFVFKGRHKAIRRGRPGVLPRGHPLHQKQPERWDEA